MGLVLCNDNVSDGKEIILLIHFLRFAASSARGLSQCESWNYTPVYTGNEFNANCKQDEKFMEKLTKSLSLINTPEPKTHSHE